MSFGVVRGRLGKFTSRHVSSRLACANVFFHVRFNFLPTDVRCLWYCLLDLFPCSEAMRALNDASDNVEMKYFEPVELR